MKFKINSESLAKVLGLLAKAIPVKPSLPILTNFVFDVKGDILRVTASDSDLTMRAVLTTDEVTEEGTCLIPAKLLIDLLKNMPSCAIGFEQKAGESTILCTWENGESQMPTFDQNDYPAIKAPEQNATMVTISQDSLADGIAKTVSAVAEDETRPQICGIFFDIKKDGLTLVGTDAKRIMFCEYPDIKSPEDSSFILNKKAATALKGVLGKEGECKICYNKTHVRIVLGGFEIITTQVTGRFPNYRSVIPTDNHNILQVDRQTLLNAIKRIAVCADKTTTIIRIDLTFGEIKLSAQDLGFSISAKEKMSCDYDGEDIAIGFKAPALMEILGCFGTELIELRFKGGDKSTLIVPTDDDRKDEPLTALLMPIMINK